jgi:lipoyl(octanoyl) transferase
MHREETSAGGGHWEVIDTGESSGADNMAFDESLARRRAEGTGASTLRFFRWKPWAISVGYNQGTAELDAARCAADGIAIVRRPTGGRAILHAEELTYSVVMPAGRKSILQIYNEISRALVRGLALYGVDASLQKSQPNFAEEYRNPSSLPCFSSSARYEIEWQGRKLVGSAQRRYAGSDGDAVLQHGSILCGPAHLRLADYLLLEDAATAARIRRVLTEKTVDLGAITGAPVDTAALAACLRRGFELEWNVTFVPAAASGTRVPQPV